MNPSSRRAIFLQEMGVGPHWQLRQSGAASSIEAQEVEVEVKPVLAALAPATPPAAMAHAAAPAVDAAPPVKRPVAQVPLEADRAKPDPAGALAGPDYPATPAAAVPPGSRTPALDDDSTAWFDDAPMPAPAPPVSDEAIAAMGWAELRAAAAKCTRCALARGRKAVVFGRGAERADWLLLGSAPSRADEKEGRPVSGDASRLLENMLQAIGVVAQDHAYVTNLVKCRPHDGGGADRPVLPEELAACRPFLERELALTAGKTVVVFGQEALRGLLGGGAPAARGTVHALGDTRVVATYHPEDLLRQGENKAKAWADLCLARQAHDERG